MRLTAAERKTFLSKKMLEYVAGFRVDGAAREFGFMEVLKETGSEVSGGGGDMSPGFGFKAETYETGAGPREGTITEQSDYFSKQYTYRHDWSAIRTRIEQAAAAGYRFSYSINSITGREFWKVRLPG